MGQFMYDKNRELVTVEYNLEIRGLGGENISKLSPKL